MKEPVYASYAPSGINWLGDIPENWKIQRLKTIAKYWVSNVDKVPSDEEEPVLLCNYTDVYYNEFIHPGMELMETTATPDEIRKFGLKVGDVVITKDSEEWDDIAVPSLVTGTTQNLLCGYHLAIIRPNQEKILGTFLFRSLQSSAINYQFQIASSGVTRYGLPKNAIGDSFLVIPSITEQQKIVSFLDQRFALLDLLIIKKKGLIEKLKEKRTALIARTITRGLSPECAHAAGLDADSIFISSGSDWFGDIPNHWSINRLGLLTLKIGSGKTPKGGAGIYQSEGVLLIRSQNVHDTGLRINDAVYIDESTDEEMANTRVLPCDILLNITGASLGRCAIVPEGFPRSNVNQHVCIIRIDKQKNSPKFFRYAILSIPIQSQIFSFETGSSREGLNFYQIQNLLVTVPPVSEQVIIAEYLDSETSAIDCMIEKNQESITRLQEYRIALINATVTGKIDVRGAT